MFTRLVANHPTDKMDTDGTLFESVNFVYDSQNKKGG